jgi:hypothetical protein
MELTETFRNGLNAHSSATSRYLLLGREAFTMEPFKGYGESDKGGEGECYSARCRDRRCLKMATTTAGPSWQALAPQSKRCGTLAGTIVLGPSSSSSSSSSGRSRGLVVAVVPVVVADSSVTVVSSTSTLEVSAKKKVFHTGAIYDLAGALPWVLLATGYRYWYY